MDTFSELKEKLALVFNPDELVELLNLDSEDIVERFSDIIEKNQEYYADVLVNYIYDGAEGEETV